MTPDQTKEEIPFHAARALSDPEQRAAFLDAACQGDNELRRGLEALLAADATAQTLFERSPQDQGRMVKGQCPRCGSALPADVLDGLCPKCLAQVFASGPQTVLAVSEQAGDRIDRYKLLQKIGEGGCGVVYMAEQEQPVRRRVALKVIKLGMDTRSVIARFEAERQALAMMDHPNIAKVLDVGATESGRPFFVMELVRGFKITEYCDQNSLSTTDRLKLFTQVCHAIQHAHQKGVIHRDIKPSNVLVTENDGVPVPKVIDFGIAKATNEQRLTDKTLFTAFEQFIGTPAYMSPEQAAMTSLDIDTRSDIYSLGVLLYELLTGRTPFDPTTLLQAGLDEMRRIIREQEPARPSTRLSTLADADLTEVAKHRKADAPKLINLPRGDLDWIVMKALEKDRTRRYDTANGLATDIQRHLNSEPVTARPPSAAYRFQKLVRRNKLAFAAASAVIAALLLGVIVSRWQALRATQAERKARAEATRAQKAEAVATDKSVVADQERQRAETERQRAVQSESLSRQFLYASDMNLAQHALAANNFGGAHRLLDRHRPKPGEPDLRDWEWRYAWQYVQSDASFVLARMQGYVAGLTFSPDGKLLAAAGSFGPARVWDVAKRQLLTEIPGTEDIGRAIAFSPRGDLLAVDQRESRTNGILALLDVKTWRAVGQLPGGPGKHLAFSRDGKLLATQFHPEPPFPYPDTTNDPIRVLDVDTKTELATFRGSSWVGGGLSGVVAFSPDGKLIAVGDQAGKVRVLDWSERKERLSFSVTGEAVTVEAQIIALAFSPVGNLLATGTGFKASPIKLWDTGTGNLVTNLVGHRAWISWLAFSPDGRVLASSSADQTVRLWDMATCQEIATLKGHMNEVYTLAFSSDGKTLASGDKDGSIQFWEVAVKPPPDSLTVLPPSCFGTNCINPNLQFTPDGRSYAVLTGDRGISFYDTANGSLKQKLLRDLWSDGSTNWLEGGFAFSPRGELILGLIRSDPNARSTGRDELNVRVFDLKTQRVVTNIVTEGVDGSLLLSTTRKTLATVIYPHRTDRWSLRLFDTTSWSERCSLLLERGAWPYWIASFSEWQSPGVISGAHWRVGRDCVFSGRKTDGHVQRKW